MNREARETDQAGKRSFGRVGLNGRLTGYEVALMKRGGNRGGPLAAGYQTVYTIGEVVW